MLLFIRNNWSEDASTWYCCQLGYLDSIKSGDNCYAHADFIKSFVCSETLTQTAYTNNKLLFSHSEGFCEFRWGEEDVVCQVEREQHYEWVAPSFLHSWIDCLQSAPRRHKTRTVDLRSSNIGSLHQHFSPTFYKYSQYLLPCWWHKQSKQAVIPWVKLSGLNPQ